MTLVINNPDNLATAWNQKPEIIRSFIEMRPEYERLCNEVEYILGRLMKNHGIQFAAITSRAKTLKSFAEKIVRKSYENPLNEVTDLAGVRLVYLYTSDLSVIEGLIESEFEVIEKIDKIDQQEPDQFGYGAIHYLVKLGGKSTGARYDDLKNMICEIQVRTVLQDAWAIIDHHLSYKQESDVPKRIKRKLNSLAGLFETADDQFDKVRYERQQYKDSIVSKLSTIEVFLNQEINLDTFTEYLKWKYPERNLEPDDKYISNLIASATKSGLNKLKDIDSLLLIMKSALPQILKEMPDMNAAGIVMLVLGIRYKELSANWDNKFKPYVDKYNSLFIDA